MAGIGAPSSPQQMTQFHLAKWNAIKAQPPLGVFPDMPGFAADPVDTGASSQDQFLSAYQSSFKQWDAQSGHKGYLNQGDVRSLLEHSPDDKALLSMESYGYGHEGAVFQPDAIRIGEGKPQPLSTAQKDLGDQFQSQKDYDAFKHRYQENFLNWDAQTGHKGYLTNHDIDTLMQDPHIKGDDAAALGATKTFLDSQYGDIHLNRNGAFLSGPPNEGQTPINFFTESRSSIGHDYGETRSSLAGASHELFAHGTPDWKSVKQRDNGDCFLEAPLTSLAKERPDDVKKMISENKDGSYTVHFPGHEPVSVARPTDAEIAHYSNNGADGTWSTVISKAYGQMRYREGTFTDEGLSGREPADGASGGDEAVAIRDLTGHGVHQFKLKDPTPNPLGAYTDAAAQGTDSSTAQVRQGLVDGLKDGHIAAASTRHYGNEGNTTYDGLPQGHALTVLGYDQKTDTISLRNPWGNKPQDHVSSSIQQDDNGVMHMKLSTFMHNFGSLSIEDPSRKPAPLTPGVRNS